MTKPRRTEQNWNFTLLLLFFRFSSVSVEGHKRVALQLVTGSQYWSRGLSPLRDREKRQVNIKIIIMMIKFEETRNKRREYRDLL